MSRLPRPHIPISIRLQVAKRQVQERGILVTDDSLKPKEQLRALLAVLFGDQKRNLDHDPALGARPYNKSVKNVAARYTPNANDPNHLIYRTKVDHQIKTNVRGEHGQHPDRVLIKKNRRLERGPKAKMGRSLTQGGKKSGTLVRRRVKIRSANRWPKGRKIQNRKRP